MKQPIEINYTRHHVMVEIRFVNGRECCEWCNMSYRNLKRHMACKITEEEMVSPQESIGYFCPLRKEYENGNYSKCEKQ